jgi:hypothetical protein
MRIDTAISMPTALAEIGFHAGTGSAAFSSMWLSLCNGWKSRPLCRAS